MTEKSEQRDFKKLLGNPKIIFVIGGPASGKGTQCVKLVEEFGYTHISTGELMRAEMNKGTKEGERIRKIVDDGGLVPFDLTVQILINALMATPSKNYLIDGFPRAVDQAQYFEQNVVETQQVLYYDVPEDIMVDRCLKRAETSGRTDDNEETIKKRVQNYFETTFPVVEYYKRFGKVRKIDACREINEVYADTKAAVMPQIMFAIGPKASGKSTISDNLCFRTNMKSLNFDEFVAENGYSELDDEAVTLELIHHLSKEIRPRVIIENFPQNLFQAKFFLRNGKIPSDVFCLKCPKDVCQERMTLMGKAGQKYVSSAVLSKNIKEYFDSSKTFLPFLKENTNFHEINTASTFDQTIEDVNKFIEPCVIHVRPGANSNDLRKDIIEKLTDEHDFVNLDVNALIRDENERKTAIGLEFLQMVSSGKIIPAEMIVRMLKKIIYCGEPSVNKFILTSFPDIIEQAKEFELNCAKISAIIYSTSDDSIVEIKNNNLSLFNIDSLFQKEFRLKTMKIWDFSLFQEKLGNKISYAIIQGSSFSGKSTVAGMMAKDLGWTVIDMKGISEKVKGRLGSEDEPFEGEVPIAEVEKDICAIIKKGADSKAQFVFDGFTHASVDAFLKFLDQFGSPECVVYLDVKKFDHIKKRFMLKNETEEVGEEAEAELKKSQADAQANFDAIINSFSKSARKVQEIHLDTDNSLETTLSELKGQFQPKVILVNHEKRLGVDTTCSNLAIKYNMIYLSAYQIIRHHIDSKTEWGKKLLISERKKNIILTTQVRDEFHEADFSPVHFDQNLVMELLKMTIKEKRTDQKYILLEGLCNSAKLADENDHLECRFMDEFFAIEKYLGEVTAIVGLQFEYESEFQKDDDLVYEEFKEPEAVAEKPKAEGEDGEEPPAEGEKKVPDFKPENYKWTVSNKQATNLPQLFLKCKGAVATHDKKTAEQFSSSQYEAISKSLDEFCRQVHTHLGTGYFYQQVIFSE